MPPPTPIPPDAVDCAANRVRFLTAGETAPDRVRPAILASWRRSREHGIAADRVHVPYEGDPEIDTPLTRTSSPVLARLADRLAGQAVSIILTDASGLVLGRRTLDASFERRLDRVLLAPGFSYAEQFAGTNGIGTALESGSATQVLGHEHYAEDLETFACAAVPIHDPITGRLLGVLDLTCQRSDTDTLLLALAETTAEQIQQALLVASRQGELALLHAYRQACRHTSGPVFALAGDTVTFNDRARVELGAEDQAAVLAHAAEIGAGLSAGRRRSALIELPTGRAARLHCRQVSSGTIVHVSPVSRESSVLSHPLPGLVGTSAAWQRAASLADAALRSGSWLALVGEPGVGKRALARAVLRAQRPTARVADSVRPDADAVIISDVDDLSAGALRSLRASLAASSAWVVVTLRPGTRTPELESVLKLFPRSVAVPPLRLRLEDLPALAQHFLGGSLSPDALAVLMRAPWPGNVAQLRSLVSRLGASASAAALAIELQSMSRHVLAPIEAVQRDAIVASLAAAGGNKQQAAQALGISRATIYRRIREYGIGS